MKALVLAQKDIRTLLNSKRFIFSILLSSFGIVAVKILMPLLMSLGSSGGTPSGLGISFSATFWALIVFTISLPILGFAVSISNSDIFTRERSEGTIQVLFIQPISNMSIILGKFLTMSFTSLIFSLWNVLLIKLLLSDFLGTFLPSESVLLPSFFFAVLLFQLSTSGFTLLCSSIFKRSVMVLIVVILVSLVPGLIYAYQLRISGPGYEGTLGGASGGLGSLASLLVMLLGAVLGYAMVILPGSLSGLGGTTSQSLTITEPAFIRFTPINVNAQRLFYFLTSPNLGIETLEPIASTLALVGIIALSLFLSLLVIRKARMEYMD